MEIPLLQGRYFSDHDTTDGQRAAIIDEHFARRFWPHDNPIGKHLWFDPRSRLRLSAWWATSSSTAWTAIVKLWATFPNLSGAAEVCIWRRAPSPIRPPWPIPSWRKFTPLTRTSWSTTFAACRIVYTLRWRAAVSLALSRSFAIFAMLLAAIGVYGVFAYMVSQNRHEIGIRMALGARSGSIVGMVLRQGLSLAGAGIVAGLVGAVALTRLMASLLFGVSAVDWITFSTVTLLLALVALGASVIPATRAIKIDPTVALRSD